MNSVRLDICVYVLLKRITAKNNYVEQRYLKKHLSYTILMKYCVMVIYKNSNCCSQESQESLPERNYKSI